MMCGWLFIVMLMSPQFGAAPLFASHAQYATEEMAHAAGADMLEDYYYMGQPLFGEESKITFITAEEPHCSAMKESI